MSSALGKELGAEALNGNSKLLKEAVQLCSFRVPEIGEKQIRAGAAKIVEIVAEKEPSLVVPYLESLLPALEAPEPQTRWMLLRTFGFCASLSPGTAEKAFPAAKTAVEKKEGLCIASSADLYLGDLGAVSPELCAKVLPLLLKSMKHYVYNEQDWLMEAFIKLTRHIPIEDTAEIKTFAQRWKEASRKTTQARSRKLIKNLSE